MTTNLKTRIQLCVISLLLIIPLLSNYGQVSTPEKYLGYKPGEDFHLATYEDLTGYFDLVAKETDRLQMFDMGPTTEGRRMRYAIISSGKNMANLARYKEIVRKLSLVKGISMEEAKKLSREGKVVVWIDSGLHSSETSPPMHQFQLVYELVTSKNPDIEFIRENVILLLVQANPDGMTKVANWYSKNVGTKYETSSMPELYNKYAGHDNNRDFHMANLLETQNINRCVGTEWFPELMYAQHETAPFPARIWMPPNADPVHPNTHPVVLRWKNMIGAAMGRAFDAAGQTGAISRNGFDLWYPGYEGGPSFESHNIPTVLTETANFRYATPHFYTIRDFPESYRDLVKGTFYPSPWEGGWWRLSDAIEYNLTASKSILDLAARYRYEFLYSKYQTAKDVIEKFSDEPPYGWIFSTDQTDQNAMALLLNNFLDNGIDIYRSDEAFSHEGLEYPSGSYFIPTNQAFGLYPKTILEKQEYPDMRKYPYLWQGVGRQVKTDGTPITPYDGVGWTLPIQMGVNSHQMSSPLDIKKTIISEKIIPTGEIKGKGSYFILSPEDNYSYTAIAKILEEGGTVSRAESSFSSGDKNFPAGSLIINSRCIARSSIERISSETHTIIQAGQVDAKLKPIKKSRIALYKSWAANMDAGWISFILDKFEIPYHMLTDAEVRAGNLNTRFDVILLPDQGAYSIINGNQKGTMPPDYVGGITYDGVDNLKKFVEKGGRLVCNRSSVDLAIKEFNLPIKNVLTGVKSQKFNCPGSILKVKYDIEHPLTYGLRENSMVYFSHGKAFEIVKDSIAEKKTQKNKSSHTDEELIKKNKSKISIIATYPDESLLISGWILGDELIRTMAAIMDVSYKKGNILLFGFNIHNRAQSYLNFKLLFNAIYFHK